MLEPMNPEDRPRIAGLREGHCYDSASGEVVHIQRAAEGSGLHRRFVASNGWRYSANGSFRGDFQPSPHDLIRHRGVTS